MKNAAALAGGSVTMRVFVTGGAGEEEKGLESPSSDKASTDGDDSTTSAPFVWSTGRPDIRTFIIEKGKTCSGNIGVAGKSAHFT